MGNTNTFRPRVFVVGARRDFELINSVMRVVIAAGFDPELVWNDDLSKRFSTSPLPDAIVFPEFVMVINTVEDYLDLIPEDIGIIVLVDVSTAKYAGKISRINKVMDKPYKNSDLVEELLRLVPVT